MADSSDEGKQHGPWVINASKKVYADPWITVQRDEVTRPDGAPGSYATVQLKSGVCVLAIDDERNLKLTREFHYAVGRDTIEGVSGGIEDGETAIEAAKRELAEEIGFVADTWTHLGTIDPFTAAIYSTVDLYLAQGLTPCETDLEGTELITCVTMPLDSAVEAVRRSEITHAPTCVAILRVALDGRQLLG